MYFIILIKGGSALDAVEAATRNMEDSEELNAGRGSYLTEEGTVELDAMIMDGQTLNTGKLICNLLLNVQCCKRIFLVKIGPCKFEFEIPVILTSKPFLLDLIQGRIQYFS